MIRAVVGAALCAASLVYFAWAAPVQADEMHMHLYHADAQHDEWLRSLQRPDSKGSCCSLNDCNPTDAEWRDGQWWAVLRGNWIAIPPEKVLATPKSLDGEAWLCASLSSTFVYCFVPPLNNY